MGHKQCDTMRDGTYYSHSHVRFQKEPDTDVSTVESGTVLGIDSNGDGYLAVTSTRTHPGAVALTACTKPKTANIARRFNSYSGKHLLERYPELRESYCISGEADPRRLNPTWRRQEQRRRKSLNDISERQSTHRSDTFYPCSRWGGELVLPFD